VLLRLSEEVIDDSRPAAARRHHVIYLLLSGAYFGLHALNLSAVSIVSLRSPHGILIAGIGVALYSGLGLTCDLAVGAWSTRSGAPLILRFGVGLCGVGTLSLFALSGALWALVGASFLALGTSFLNVPILAGVANTAPIAKQVASQSLNAGIQRTGALCATAFLVGLTVHSDTKFLSVGMAVLLTLILLGSFLLGTPERDLDMDSADPGWASLKSDFVAFGLMVGRSPGYQVAVIGNLVTVMLVIYGSSFLISALQRIDQQELLAPGIAARELVAALTALIILRRASMQLVRTFWAVSALAGAVGLAVLPLTGGNPAVCVLLIAIHGAAISGGIVFTNTMIHVNVPADQTAIGFAGESVVAKLFGITFPLTLVGLGGTGPALGGVLALVFAAVIVAFVAARLSSTQTC
jgi:hypothetical protein